MAKVPLLKPLVTAEDFYKIDVRVGTVIQAHIHTKAHKPAIILVIDFGPTIGHKKSSAQITVHYTPDTLIGRQVIALVNIPPRQIGPIMSEVLVLGISDEAGAIVLLASDRPVPNGSYMH